MKAKKTIANALAPVARKSAVAMSWPPSMFTIHQPKTPAKLMKTEK